LVLVAVTVKIIIFWDVMPCILAEIYTPSSMHACIFLVFLKWKQHIPLKDHYMAIRLHDMTSQQIVIFLSEFSV